MNINARKLRIKAKHLAEESRIIRREAQKTSGSERQSLNNHRTWDVRNEARATQLAYQFLRGEREYSEIEGPKTDTHFRKLFIDARIIAMIKKYGEAGDVDRLAAWLGGSTIAKAA